MDSLVLELQKEALNPSVGITDLLRKSLVVSRKLGIREFQNWIEFELNGYSDQSKIPVYRNVTGQIKAWNPIHGWIPYMIDDVDMVNKISKRKINQPIGEIETILKADRNNSSFEIPFPNSLELSLMKLCNLPLRPSLLIDRAKCYGILEAVRNIIVEWTLKLEENNILGEGMAFSIKEKEVASAITYNIKNFISQGSHSQIQQDTANSSQSLSNYNIDIDKLRYFVQIIKESIGNLDTSEQNKSELGADIDTIQTQILSPKPKTSIIHECLRSIRNILEGIAGNVLAARLLEFIGPLLK